MTLKTYVTHLDFGKEVIMDFTQYQKLAQRTINNNLTNKEKECHALHGMIDEICELHSIYQKAYQGHDYTSTHVMRELGDLLWFMAEYCTVMGWNFNEVASMNIGKLKERYPEGFDIDRSLHRNKDDV